MRNLARTRLPEALVLLAALVTRVWRLDYHSFWFDESVSMTWARSAPDYTWDVTLQLVKDKHPPVYYLLLHFWREGLKWVGLENNDVALRLLGSLLGVLTVLGLLLLARRLSGRGVGLLAAALAAVSPVLVWYSQELRMFQPATTGLVWGAYCLLRATESPTWTRRVWWWIGMVAAFELALYAYLFAAFAVPAAGVVLLGLAVLDWQARRRVLVEGGVALAVTGLIFAPLARNAWLANSAEGAPGQAFADLGQTLWRQVQIATIWRVDWPEALQVAVVGLATVAVLIGLVAPRRLAAAGLRNPDRLWLWAWIGTPLLVGNLLLARNDTIFAEDRYFLFVAPFWLWAVARGVYWTVGRGWQRTVTQPQETSATGYAAAFAAKRRHLGAIPDLRWGVWIGGLLAVGVMAAALPRLWSPAMLREDWRAAATYIADYQDASPGLPGAVVAHIDYTRTPLNWYLRPRYDRDKLPLYFPFGGPIAPENVEQAVAPPLLGIQAEGATTLWLTQSHLDGLDDARVVEGWLNQNYPLVTEQYPTGIKLSGYALQSRFDRLPELAPNAVRPDVALAPNLTLAACEIVTPAVSATDERMHPPSGWVHVRLWWHAEGPIAGDYIPTVQMIGPEGVWGDRLYRDNEALRRWPTGTWTPGVFIRDEVDVNLNPVTPPGEYPIVVGVRDANNAEGPTKVECGRVRVD